MDKLIIKGKEKLGGNISVSGAKNAALPILAATVIVDGECVIHNCPSLADIDVALDILSYLGAAVEKYGDTVIINTKDVDIAEIPDEMMREMRSSIIFLASLLSRFGEARMSSPGGCDIGVRPVDLHLWGLQCLGATIYENGSEILCKTEKTLHGERIVLPFPSVGATENIMIAAAVAKGTTTLINAAREPEITDLANFLNCCGAKIKPVDDGTIIIEGVDGLHDAEYDVMPDRIVASTYLSAGAITGSQLTISNVSPSSLSPVFPVFLEMGCAIFVDDGQVRIKPPKNLHRVRSIKTMPYPGFPTDSGPLIAAVLTKARGTSVITETIFENRFRYVSELMRFGADISLTDKSAIISGKKELYGTSVKCTDLRGGAALVIAALAAEGTSQITNLYHIDRGYQDFEGCLTSLGASIKRINDEKK